MSSQPPSGRKRHEPSIDALPEFFPYRDDGCDVSPSCLNCPLRQCKYDDPQAYHQELRRQRDHQVLLAHAGGASAPDLARRFHVSKRTILRILASQAGGKNAAPMNVSNCIFCGALVASEEPRKGRKPRLLEVDTLQLHHCPSRPSVRPKTRRRTAWETTERAHAQVTRSLGRATGETP